MKNGISLQFKFALGLRSEAGQPFHMLKSHMYFLFWSSHPPPTFTELEKGAFEATENEAYRQAAVLYSKLI